MHKPLEVFNRLSGEREIEPVMGGIFIRLAYDTAAGRLIWSPLFHAAGISRLMGKWFDSRFSRRQIKRFVRDLDINAAEAEHPLKAYGSFNDFFSRKLKTGVRPFEPSENSLSSPADGRLLVYPSCANRAAIPVKGATRTLNELCAETLPDGDYAVAVVRLCPADYHRFHFPCSCRKIGETRAIAGKFHSVNPLALQQYPNVFAENARHVTLLESDVFGTFRYIEVGAFGVGTIVETASETIFPKMAEKGYFRFGGSTVILVFDACKVRFDTDLLENSADGIESRVRAGNEIASRKI